MHCAGSDASSFTAEAAVGTNWVQAGKQLQARWQQLAYENMHLMVSLNSFMRETV